MKYFIVKTVGPYRGRQRRVIDYITSFWPNDNMTIGKRKVNSGQKYNNPLDYLVKTKKKNEVILFKSFNSDANVIDISEKYVKMNCIRSSMIWTEWENSYTLFYKSYTKSKLFIDLLKEGFEEVDI